MKITRLVTSDALRYRALMLEAYEHAADAFTSTAEERSVEPVSWWEQRIASSTGLSDCFGAIHDGRLVGAVALEYSAKPKTMHSALVIGMYLQPAYRRTGAAAGLLQAAVSAALARQEIQVLRLTVTDGNETAIRLYSSAGFVVWGIEPHAIRTASGYKSKVHMALINRRSSSVA